MLTRENDVEVHALHKRGWTISAIARHTGHDRKTIRAYLKGERSPGERKKSAADPFEPFLAYVTARLVEDPHLWSRTLCDELEDLGYTQSYPTLTRQIRQRGLRPTCEACALVTERANAVVEHPPGEETQWDWVELPNPPDEWGWGSTAFLLVGSLAHSGKWRGYLAPDMTRPQVIAGIDRITRRLGGVTKSWRFDRMATVCHPSTGALTAEFADVAKYYGVSVDVCPPRRGNRKGVVEKSNHTAAQRWWRTLPDETTPEQAQTSCDTFCRTRSDARMRPTSDGRASVIMVAAREPLSAPPAAPYPATLTEMRTVSRQALVAWRGNQYSVPPEVAMSEVTVSERLGDGHIDIATDSGIVIARHRLATPGSGAQVRDHGHVVALETLAKAGASSSRRPHRRKERIPPGQAARDAANTLRHNTTNTDDTGPQASIIDMSVYERAAQNRTHLP
ncbi:DDE-type integrase/transposase/recombinase [Gordonia sp. w5E2]|uniref:Transcriptional regulator n=2 Tax=Gordonia TaxID=2053 RepID=A0ABR5I6L0_9ACTN|nr:MULTISPECIES: DDE-type integrase/transposase/recombinase [Gordonia]KNA89314.1 transcriptional regulator [Gordonia jacobaea]UEA57387.1 DDE-type integrase/transposase/recombinase [Gordonia otitidis]GAC51100.1 putative transposase [Gordonia aichiensis NBRC 108223]